MLYRKISKEIENHLKNLPDKILIVEGARQVGKSYIIRDVGKRLFNHFVELNFVRDNDGEGIYRNIHTTEEFYLTLSMHEGANLGNWDNTLVFLDEIQQYPQYLTLLKFLREDRRYRFIASGSLLGITLRSTTSIPIGSIIRKNMTQLDFGEFAIANGMGQEAIDAIGQTMENGTSLTEEQHSYMMNLFRRYLLVGGMPDAVNEYLATRNIVRVREVQESIRSLYGDDASKYESESRRKLLIRRIYDMIPSQMENKKKRIMAKNVRGKSGDRFETYSDEFEYLISSSITLASRAITNPLFPLKESAQKNLLKLYLNDVGMLTSQLYGNNIRPILEDMSGINLGAVYESVVAQELKAHGFTLYYYDNRQKGEVDFLIDNYKTLSALPIEVKSGKDYTVHSALNNLLTTPDYHVNSAIVLSNDRRVRTVGSVHYMPIYYVMFLTANATDEENLTF